MHSFDGSGTLYFQFQSNQKKPPLTWAAATFGKDSRIKIENIKKKNPTYIGKKGEPAKLVGYTEKKYVLVKIRISAGKNPTWIEKLIYMDRPLPNGVFIKWIYWKREKIGTKFSEKLQFVISHKQGFTKEDNAINGQFGLDTNWRQINVIGDQYDLLVASWIGNNGTNGELIISCDLINYFKKTRELQQIRDKHFNEIKNNLIQYLKKNPVPEWLAQNLNCLEKWKSQFRLRKLFTKWSEERFYGDGKIYNNLSEWNSKEIHLYNWERCQEKKFIDRRNKLYRKFWVSMRTQYNLGFIEKLRIDKMIKTPSLEKKDNNGVRKNQNIVSPGLFLSMGKEVMKIFDVAPVNTTKKCFICKKITAIDKEKTYKCEHCGNIWDRDLNSAKNILERGQLEYNKILAASS